MHRTDAKSIRKVLKVSDIEFNEFEHSYKCGDKEYQGITSTLIPFAYPHTYDVPEGMTEEQWHEMLMKAAAKGTAVHESIQNYCENGLFPQTQEGYSWMKAEDEHNIQWIANEYLVSHGNFASKIDILAFVDGELSIIDIKRTSKIHYDTTTLQTSLYKAWFEEMNPGVEVKNIYIFWCREDKWELVKLCPIGKYELDELINAYERNDTNYVFNPLPSWCSDALVSELADLVETKSTIEERIKELQKELEEGMVKYNMTTMDTNMGIKVQYVAPTKTKTFDKKRFESENPGVLDSYMKESTRQGCIKILKKKDNE